MQAAAIVFTSPKNLKVQILELAGFCKQSLNFSFAQPFTGDKPSKAARAYQSLLAMQPA
jgi:hypothetical protein